MNAHRKHVTRVCATLIPVLIAALSSGGCGPLDDDRSIGTQGQALDRWAAEPAAMVEAQPVAGELEEIAPDEALTAPRDSLAPALPELMVTDLVLPSPAATTGMTAQWQVTIRNVSGIAATQPFTVLLAADGQPFFVQSVNGLAGNTSLTLTTTTASSPLGTETISATVDYTNAILEISEQQGTAGPDANTLTKSFTTGQVRLALTALSLNLNSHGAIKLHDTLKIAIEITNQGTAAATHPFYVSVYPGQLDASGIYVPEVIRVTQPVAAGAKLALQHTVSMQRTGPLQATAGLDVSLTKPDFIYKSGIAATSSQAKAFKVWGMIGGRLYDTRGDGISVAEMQGYVQGDPQLPWYRKAAALVALGEMEPKVCGEAARERYDADGLWCSEFARWVLIQAGMDDASELWDITLTRELVEFFADRGRFTWAAAVKPSTAMPGDFLSMTTYGIKKNHSTIVIAVTHDDKRIWLAHGNSSDCTRLGPQDYFVNGKLAPDLDGFGTLDSSLFGYIVSRTIP